MTNNEKSIVAPADPDSAIAWLERAARYFESRDTGGEDAAHWANIINCEMARKIATLIVDQRMIIAGLQSVIDHAKSK